MQEHSLRIKDLTATDLPFLLQPFYEELVILNFARELKTIQLLSSHFPNNPFYDEQDIRNTAMELKTIRLLTFHFAHKLI